ncbi:adenosine receptor A1-like isoform X2 [Ptychodera flava]
MESHTVVYNLESTEPDTSSNLTSPYLTSSDLVYYCFYYTIIFLITLFTIIGNLLVISCVVRYRHLKNCCNYFILNLAVSDLLMGLIYTPYNLSHMEIPQIRETMNTWHLCLFLLAGVEVFHCCSAWSLVAITVTRYISIFDPLRYHDRVTARRTAAAIVSIWIFSAFYSFVQYVRPVHKVNFHGLCRYELMYDELWHSLTISTVVVLIPLVIMMTLYIRIWLVVRKQVRAMSIEHGHSFRHELKVTKMIAMILGYFCLAWMPLLIFLFVEFTCHCEINRYIRAVVRIFLHTNSAVNFVVYGMCNREFRAAFKSTLTPLFCCENVRPKSGHVDQRNGAGVCEEKAQKRLVRLCKERKQPIKDTFL